MIQESLQRLVSFGLLSDPSAITDWANALADLNMNELAIGLNKAKDFKDYLTMGDFREMCKIPKGHASFRRYKALPIKSVGADEHHRRTAQMKEELGLN